MPDTLTRPQREFMSLLRRYGFTFVYPGSTTQIANNLVRKGLIRIDDDTARLTYTGKAYVAGATWLSTTRQ
jgi:hypothetical protein